jgi:uncharacterized membrane protein YphA (DoxX/SURF4 family)
MKTAATLKAGNAIEIAAVAARWLLGAFFLYAGLVKALHPEEFLKLVRQYGIVDTPVLLNAIASSLPWFEAFCGLLLLCGVAVRGAASVLALMLAPFTLIVFKHALAIQGTLGVAFCAVKFDCGCGTGEVFICHKLVENGVSMLLLAGLAAGHGRRFCLRHSLMK